MCWSCVEDSPHIKDSKGSRILHVLGARPPPQRVSSVSRCLRFRSDPLERPRCDRQEKKGFEVVGIEVQRVSRQYASKYIHTMAADRDGIRSALAPRPHGPETIGNGKDAVRRPTPCLHSSTDYVDIDSEDRAQESIRTTA